MAKAGNLKLDFMAKSIGIHFFKFEDMFRCYRDNENLKKHFGHMDTLSQFSSSLYFIKHVCLWELFLAGREEVSEKKMTVGQAHCPLDKMN